MRDSVAMCVNLFYSRSQVIQPQKKTGVPDALHQLAQVAGRFGTARERSHPRYVAPVLLRSVVGRSEAVLARVQSGPFAPRCSFDAHRLAVARVPACRAHRVLPAWSAHPPGRLRDRLILTPKGDGNALKNTAAE